MTATVEINLRVTPAELQSLYRSIVCQADVSYPMELVQKIYNTHHALRQPLIIEMEIVGNGQVQEKTVGNNRVPDEPVSGPEQRAN